MGLLTEWLDKIEVTRKEVESLVGKLSFICHVCETGTVVRITPVGVPERCQRWGRWRFRGSKEGLTVVEGISSVLQWGVHDVHGKMVLTGWSGGDRCLFEWLWCLVWYSDWVLSCRIPWRNQDAESDYQRIGATNSGGSSKGLGKEVLWNANCDQVQ